MSKLRYVSLFSGIEAVSCALDHDVWEPVAFSEIDPFPCAEVAANIYQCDVTMRDTRRVTCLVYADMPGAGMSCDWTHADGSDNLQEKDH